MRTTKVSLLTWSGIVARFSLIVIPQSCGLWCTLALRVGESSSIGPDVGEGNPGQKQDEIEKAIVERFGLAARHLGSGVDIQEWDVESGTRMYGFGGLVSFQPKAGRWIWVTETVSKALPTIAATDYGFQMTTRPERRTKYWLGNVTLRPDTTYEFLDSNDNLYHRANQAQNFFIKHPRGRFEIQFAPGCTADTVLDRLPDKTLLCRLIFSPIDGGTGATYDIIAYQNERQLDFEGKRPQVFLLEKSW
jgi:hypothetical protein